MSIFPDGNIYPCCRSDKYVVASSPSANIDLTVIQNSPVLKTMRTKMMKGEKCIECEGCYEQERSHLISNRKIMNHQFHKMINLIKDDHPLPLHFLELRFSNICNYRCRICHSDFSSSLGAESDKFNLISSVQYFYGKKDFDLFLKSIHSVLPTLGVVYFAGGESFLDEHHRLFLDYLRKNNATHIKLDYNTNLSVLPISLWDDFEDVVFNVSLDGCNREGDYIRKGQNWNHVLNNLLILKNNYPKIKLSIQTTLSVFNVFHLTDFLTRLLEKELIPSVHVYINPLTIPVYYDPRMLSFEKKLIIKKRYQQFIKKKLLPFYDLQTILPLMRSLLTLADYLFSKDLESEKENFINETK